MRQAENWSAAVDATPVHSKRFPISSQVFPGVFAALDTVVILSSAYASYALIIGSQPSTVRYYVVATIFVWLIAVTLMGMSQLYTFEALLRPWAFADKIIVTYGTTFLFLLAAAFSLKISATFSRKWMALFAVTACLSTIGFRILASLALRQLASLPLFARRVAVAGIRPQINNLLEFMERTNAPFISVCGVFLDGQDHTEHAKFEHLGQLDDLASYIHAHPVDDVIIALPWSEDKRFKNFADRLRQFPVNVYLSADLIGYRTSFREPPSHFGGFPIFEVLDNPFSGWKGFVKHAEDYILGIVAAIIFLPLMLLIALAIKLESKGPALFRQDRLGYLNRVFRIYKFRTMKGEPVSETTIQATRGDPRVTKVGRLLRRTSLDELPNLINVLKGHMSLVGPRPHALDHNVMFSEAVTNYFVRHRVKPGMTGWAQVNGFRGLTDTFEKMEKRVQYDIYYAENWSLWLDMKILLMTIVICITGRNAY